MPLRMTASKVGSIVYINKKFPPYTEIADAPPLTHRKRAAVAVAPATSFGIEEGEGLGECRDAFITLPEP